MLFIIGALIGVVCFIIEILIGTTIPVIRRLARDHWLINISLSILLTWILTAMFGAAGLTVAFAAIVSLALSSKSAGLSRHPVKEAITSTSIVHTALLILSQGHCSIRLPRG